MKDNPESRAARHWKYCIEGNAIETKRVDLSTKQKNLLNRAWTWASTALLGMKEESIPDAIPRYNEDKGWHYVPVVNRDWNHIDGVGEATRLDGLQNYNRPDNVVPLSRRSHTGQGVHESDAEEEYITHRDMYQARKNLWKFKRGEIEENPMKTLHHDREEATNRGQIYHDDSYDNFFRKLARWVTSSYSQNHPNDPFPDPPNGGGVYTWNPKKKQWE